MNVSKAAKNVKSKVTKAAEFVWKGLFTSDLRINVAPGESKDARSEMREKYRALGRTQ